MACSERTLNARPEQVFAVLADGTVYARWVVGAMEVRSVDATWPQPGSQLHHTVGIGLLHLHDNTRAVAVEPDRRLVLEARGRPLGIARVEIDLIPEGTGTRVRMEEFVVRPRTLAYLDPLLSPLIWLRNVESLRRLEQVVVERAAAPPADPAPVRGHR